MKGKVWMPSTWPAFGIGLVGNETRGSVTGTGRQLKPWDIYVRL
jgi:hypothetical protein